MRDGTPNSSTASKNKSRTVAALLLVLALKAVTLKECENVTKNDNKLKNYRMTMPVYNSMNDKAPLDELMVAIEVP
jgi:hypothetical protein